MKFIRQQLEPHQIPASITAKWGDKVPLEGYVPFPKKLLRVLEPVFGPSEILQELAAVLAIVDFHRKDLRQLPSVDYLSFLSGLKFDDFRSAVTRLEAKGLVEKMPVEEDHTLPYEGVHYSYLPLLEKICESTSSPMTD